MTMDPASLWWEQITGPRRLVEDMSMNIQDGRSVILQVDNAQWWRNLLPDLVGHHVPEAQINPFTWEGGSQDQVILQLLRQLRSRELSHCPPHYRGQISYLKNEGLLSRRVIWITSEQPDMGPVLRLTSDYRGKDLEQEGTFVVEVPECQAIPQTSSSVTVISCSDYITRDDVRLFASIQANASDVIPTYLKAYAACVTETLSGLDAEWVPILLDQVNYEVEDPGDAYLRLIQEGLISCNWPSKAGLDQSVWGAQLRSAFSGIEMERLRIVSQYHDEILEALDTAYYDTKTQESGFVRQWKERPSSPYDLELATILWMSHQRRLQDPTQYLLYFSDPELRNHIQFLKDCRNKLAHHSTCTPEEMCHLLRSVPND